MMRSLSRLLLVTSALVIFAVSPPPAQASSEDGVCEASCIAFGTLCMMLDPSEYCFAFTEGCLFGCELN